MVSIADYIWQRKYRHDQDGAASDSSLDDTWRRVSTAVAEAEKDRSRWRDAFYEELSDLRFLPGGRIIAGAGTHKRVTLFNCFSAGEIEDDLGSILDSLKEAAVTMQQGGGIGCDFSNLRPSGTLASRSGATASGPVSFMQVWDTLCATLLSTSARRGAMMATLRCDHPDIEQFIAAKRHGDALTNFNLSVLVTDRFMQAIADDSDWPLVFPAQGANGADVVAAATYRRIPAAELWRQIAAAAHAWAEPGVLFIDRINHDNNLHYCESISTTNPCGEIPLPPHGACNLGSLNLPRFVNQPFSPSAAINERAMVDTVRIGVRFLDDVIDVSAFPLPEQAAQATRTRRIGLGVTGLADALIMTGRRYDREDGRLLAQHILRLIRDTAYETSIALAREKGCFPCLDKKRHLQGAFIRRLPKSIREGISEHGVRNSHLLAIAPTGTISLLAHNVSSGIEPVFALDATRTFISGGNGPETLDVRNFAYKEWLTGNDKGDDLPEAFVTAKQIPPDAHLDMQACLQPFVDGAISKTVNLPSNATVGDVLGLYARGYERGIKGCTIYRDGSLRGQVLKTRDEARCCPVERT